MPRQTMAKRAQNISIENQVQFHAIGWQMEMRAKEKKQTRVNKNALALLW